MVDDDAAADGPERDRGGWEEEAEEEEAGGWPGDDEDEEATAKEGGRSSSDCSGVVNTCLDSSLP